MYCVSLDPGQTTGVCLVQDESLPFRINIAQLGPEEHHRTLLQLLTLWKPDVLITESFENRGQDAVILASREYIGVVKAYAQLSNCTLVTQSASTAKQFWTDDKLQRYGLYVRGMKHARDATRHYLYYRTFKVKDHSLLMGTRFGSATRLIT